MPERTFMRGGDIFSRQAHLLRLKAAPLKAGHLRNKFAFPPGYHGARQAVANYIDCCAGHVHERVKSQNNEDRFGGQVECR